MSLLWRHHLSSHDPRRRPHKVIATYTRRSYWNLHIHKIYRDNCTIYELHWIASKLYHKINFDWLKWLVIMCGWYSDRFIYFRLPTYLTRINGMKRLSAHRSVNYVFSIPNGFVTPLKRWYKISSNLCTTHLFAGMEPRYTLIIHWDKTPYLFCPAMLLFALYKRQAPVCVRNLS